MNNLTTVDALYKDPAAYAGKEVTVGGWVRMNRDSKNVGFLVINDGSAFQTLQIVYAEERLEDFKEIAKLNVGSAVIATGEIVLTPDAKQPFEMQAKKIEVEGASTADYPLQKKGHTMEFLRTIPHLRARTNTFMAVYRIRSLIA